MYNSTRVDVRYRSEAVYSVTVGGLKSVVKLSRYTRSLHSWALLSVQSQADGSLSDQHGAGQVGADADEAVLVHEQIEEEALVQVLEQVVQAAERAFDQPAQTHLVVPALSDGLDGDGIDMVGDEAAVGADGIA